MMGGLRGNHHVQNIVLNKLGLVDASVRALTEVFEEMGPLQLKLREIDLSKNPIGFHKALRSPPTGLGAIGDVIKMINVSRVLSDLRLSGVGLGDRDARALCDALVATCGRVMTKIDWSDNNVGDRSAKSISRVILKYERLMYFNLTWNNFSSTGTATLHKAVAQREATEAEEKERQRRMQMMLDSRTVGTSDTQPSSRGLSTANNKAKPAIALERSTSRASRTSSSFDDVLAVNIEDDGPFGPRDGMYEFDRLNNKTLTQTVEYLETLRSRTKWDELTEEDKEDRKVEHKLIVLVDMRADGTDVHVSPKRKSPKKSPKKPPSKSAPLGAPSAGGNLDIKRTGSGAACASVNATLNASLSEADMLIDQNEYLELKALLTDEESDGGLELSDRLTILRMHLKGKKLRVLQVWEQKLPFMGSSNMFAATRFLHSRLGSQAEVEKVQALQNVWGKPRDQIFIPIDSRLSAKSATRRRTRTPVNTYLDPALPFRKVSPDNLGKSQGHAWDSDTLMQTISAKLRMRSLRSKLKSGRASLPKLTKPVIHEGIHDDHKDHKHHKDDHKQHKDKNEAKKKHHK